MAVLSVGLGSLPLGFRFRPTDEELINHYLRLKINGHDSEVQVIPEIDICKWEPWDLPGLSVIKTDDPEWFFFCPRDRKYPNGHRSNRATEAGYWKATGKDRTIKSRKSSPNAVTMIGMKKTLVFYRGRAPKGERTNWIMHEYRATEKELDGTGPGQAAFVLFRLFRKPEERTDIVRYDEVDQSASSPLTSKSSPDETSSDLIQETETPGEQEVVKRWLKDKSDKTSPIVVAPIDSCNSQVNSDIEDHGAEVTATEAYPLLGGNDHLREPMFSELDCKVFSPLQSNIQADLRFYMDSPYATDFGNDLNGFHFMDGISEQDVSLTDFLDGVFNNSEEFSGDESSQTQLPHHLPSVSCHVENNGTYSDASTVMTQVQLKHDPDMGSIWYSGSSENKEVLQMHGSSGSYQALDSMFNTELDGGMFGDLVHNSSIEALPGNSAMSLSFGLLNSMEKYTSQMNPVTYDTSVSGAGFKIRSRQAPGRPSLDNFVDQGTAPRRLRLQMKPGSVVNCKKEDASHNDDKDEDEVQSALTEASDVEVKACDSDDLQKNWVLPSSERTRGIAIKSADNLRSRVKRDGESDNSQKGSSASPTPRNANHGRSSRHYVVCVLIVLLLLSVYIGLCRWLSY